MKISNRIAGLILSATLLSSGVSSLALAGEPDAVEGEIQREREREEGGGNPDPQTPGVYMTYTNGAFVLAAAAFVGVVYWGYKQWSSDSKPEPDSEPSGH